MFLHTEFINQAVIVGHFCFSVFITNNMKINIIVHHLTFLSHKSNRIISLFKTLIGKSPHSPEAQDATCDVVFPYLLRLIFSLCVSFSHQCSFSSLPPISLSACPWVRTVSLNCILCHSQIPAD